MKCQWYPWSTWFGQAAWDISRLGVKLDSLAFACAEQLGPHAAPPCIDIYGEKIDDYSREREGGQGPARESGCLSDMCYSLRTLWFANSFLVQPVVSASISP